MCGPSDGKGIKDVIRRPGADIRVRSARKRALAAHGVGCPVGGLNLETWKLSRFFFLLYSWNITNCDVKLQQTNKKL